MARRVLADFRDGNGFVDISAFVKYDSLIVTSRAVSDNWHYAQSVASFIVNYDATLFALIRTVTEDIYVTIYDDATQIFTGYVPPTTSYSYNGILPITPISLEAVDFGEYLNVEIGDVCYRGYQIMNPADTAHSIIHQLALIAGFTVDGVDASITISDTLNAFAPPSASDKIRDLLDALLFEYGYVLHFNGSGQISPLVWRYTETTPVIEFNDNNMLLELKVQDELRTFDGAEVVYYELAEAVTTSGQTDILLYRDAKLPYDDQGAFLGYVVLSGYTYPPETNVTDPATGQDTVVYQKYEDTAIKYWTNEAIKNQLDYNYKAFTSDFSTIVATSGHYLDYDADANVQLVMAEFTNTQARIVYSGLSNVSNKLYYNNVYGKVLYKTAERSSKVENVANPKKMDRYISTFIYTKPYADALVLTLASQYATENLSLGITYGSRLPVGQLVTISGGEGTVGLGYIMEWKYAEKDQLYSYKVRTYSVTSGILSPQYMSEPSAANTPTLGITYITKGEAVPLIETVVNEVLAEGVAAYKGRYEAAHPVSYLNGDWWTVYDTDDSPIQRGVWYSNAGTPELVTASSTMAIQAKWANALTDVAWAEDNGYGTSSDYGIENLFESMAAVRAFIQTLVVQSGFAYDFLVQQLDVPDGGRIRYYNGQGVQRRAVQLADDRIDWLDTPDGGDELLVGRVGRLGVGGAILLDGDFKTPITSAWSTPTYLPGDTSIEAPISAVGDTDLTTRVAVRVRDEQVAEWVRTTSGTWTGPTDTGINDSSYPDYYLANNGDMYMLMNVSIVGTNLKCYKLNRGTGAWALHSEVSATALPGGALYESDAGTLSCIYTEDGSPYYLMKAEYNGSAWVNQTVISSGYNSISISRVSGRAVRYGVRAITGGYVWTGIIDGDTVNAPTLTIAVATRARSVGFQNTLDTDQFIYFVRSSDDHLVRYKESDSGYVLYDDLYTLGSYGAATVVTSQNGDYEFYYFESAWSDVAVSTLQNYSPIATEGHVTDAIADAIANSGVILYGGSDTAFSGRWEKSSNGKLEQWGWGYAQGDGTNTDEERAVTFPVVMASVEALTTSIAGAKDSSNPTAFTELTVATDAWCNHRATTVSGFIARLKANGAFSSTRRYGFSWHVVGKWQ